MQSEAELIAAGLSGQQKKAVANAKEAVWGIDNWLVSGRLHPATYRCLVERGLIDPLRLHSRQLTASGLAVREVLMRPPVR